MQSPCSDYMPDTGKGTGVKLAQLWFEAKGWAFAPEATVWVGKERGRRADVHLVDAFFVEMAGLGVGIKGAQFGLGKVGAALYTNEAGPAARRLNIEYEGLPVFPVPGGSAGDTAPLQNLGKLSFYGTLVKSSQPG